MAARRILIVHQNFPGQFPNIADALLARGDRVAAIGGPTARGRPGVDLRRWTNNRSTTPGLFQPATRAEADLIRADAAADAAIALRRDGFVPDLIIGHPGWGETLHLSGIFPRAKIILFGELWYQAKGADAGFDPEFESTGPAEERRIAAKNATQALAYAVADRIVSPTPFQAATFPPLYAGITTVVHEGLDLGRARRTPDARVRLPDGRTLHRGMPVITFINRNFERLRGFHVFMRALAPFLATCPDAHIALIGKDGTGYGGAAPGDRSWRAHMLAELDGRLDPSRVHFMGHVPHDRMIDLLSISAAHVYYTYPFILSWSLVEAMACECLILASDTAPVRDAVTNGVNGILNDFFDVDALSDAMIRAIRSPEDYLHLRTAARQTALDRFDQATIGVPAWLRIIDEVLDQG